MDFTIRMDELNGEQTRALLAIHLAGMHAKSPADNVHARDLSGLQMPEVCVWSAWAGDRIASIGALRALGDGGAEIKSMRTHPDFLRMVAATALLDLILATARKRGFTRLSLETGSGPAFVPALTLYRKRGFTNGNAFSDYVASAFNQFMYLDL